MYNDPGVNWGRPGPGIGTSLANATRELVRMLVVLLKIPPLSLEHINL
jgi:hypothetical protein